jgi:hypothetical protein
MVFVMGGGFIFGKTTFLVFGLENLQEIRYKIFGTFSRDATGFEMVYFPIFASRPLPFKRHCSSRWSWLTVVSIIRPSLKGEVQ